jgi:septation ring formation regulator EzrA
MQDSYLQLLLNNIIDRIDGIEDKQDKILTEIGDLRETIAMIQASQNTTNLKTEIMKYLTVISTSVALSIGLSKFVFIPIP